MSGGGMGLQRLARVFFPLTLVLVLLYITSVRLPEVQLSECMEDGKPCVEALMEKEMSLAAGKAVNPAILPSAKGPSHPEVEVYIKHCEGKAFQIKRLLAAFRACMTPDGQILLKEYLAGWEELIKFMDALGTVFGFISQETITKINIMHSHRTGKHSAEYRTLQSMVEYELQDNVVNFKELPRNRTPSGCRTVLRLHRALKWLELFLYKLATSTDHENTSDMCAEAYEVALARHHSWFIRQAAALAFLALPPRRALFDIVCVQEEHEAQLVLMTTVKAIVGVYNRTQEMYSANGMLDLP
ncbi:ceramide-1-phosphate transfer protein-like [Ambystoma mexicanum]|uniref:ceramide-1-phosphate transfer protein-like n=1 Tax=Ambystoma mexicanum TaxID=8296 RepID=UPI0037E9C408